MSRLVAPSPIIGAVEDGSAVTATPPQGDEYFARVAKYIPGEVLSGYVAMSGIVASMKPEEFATQVTAWLVFVIGLVLTPAYLIVLSKPEQPWRLHATISTFAFVIWSYALGGPFELAGVYVPQIGSILLIVFTLVAGLFRPRP